MALLRSAGLAFALAATATPAAQAHIVADPAEAAAGGYQAVRFRVGHGCSGQATTALEIAIAPGVAIARPQPKPGWRLSVRRDGERVSAIRWEGELPDGQFDEFAVLFRMPADPAVLTFPAVQTCGTAEVRWDQAAPPGGPRPERPAPTIRLSPAANPSEHRH